MTDIGHSQPTTTVLIRRPFRAVSIARRAGALDELHQPMIMNMTMAQLYCTKSKGKPYYTRQSSEVFAALELAIAKAGRRNAAIRTDDVILAALAIVQKMWERRMDELVARASQKLNRLTGFLE